MYVIELKYFDPCTENEKRYFFPLGEKELAKDYLNDAIDSGCTILLWRIVPSDKIVVMGE